MTREEILAKWDAMTPRERDALVANSVMNIKGYLSDYVVINGRRYECKTWIDEGWTADNPPAGIYPGFSPMPYSEKIEAAWEVVEKMREIFYLVQVNVYGKEKSNVIIWGDVGTNIKIICDIDAETAPEAICKAALLAVGVDMNADIL